LDTLALHAQTIIMQMDENRGAAAEAAPGTSGVHFQVAIQAVKAVKS
jgi:hypothetical protein